MNDKKLLGLAAKANGAILIGGYHKEGNYITAQFSPVLRGTTCWRPLTDDGDALRLAINLKMSIQVHHDASQPRPWLRVVYGDYWEHAMMDEFEKDPYAATRRAIVRAAAEIGKGMK